METRQALRLINPEELSRNTRDLWLALNKIESHSTHFNHVSITKDAFSDETEVALNQFLTCCNTIENHDIQTVFRFAAFSILEEISYTRKDRQRRQVSGQQQAFGGLTHNSSLGQGTPQ